MSTINPTNGINTEQYSNNTIDNNDNPSAPGAGQNAGAAFADALSQAMTEQFTTQMTHQMNSLSMFGGVGGASATSGIGGMGMGMGMGMMDTTGIENALMNAAESGEVADAQIAVLMMFMMMMMQMQSGGSDGSGLGKDMAPMMAAITQMISQHGGDVEALQNPNMHTNNLFGNAQGVAQGNAQGAGAQGPPPPLGESHIRNMVNIGLAQVGYHERNRDGSVGNGNFTKFGEWFGMNGQPWCAMFVSWVANEAGLLGDVVPRHASTTVGANAYMERGLYERRTSGYQPREGDTIFFYNPSTGRFNHVGLVVAFDPQTNRIYTVEGNTGNQVRIRHHDLNNPRIHGFGRNGGTSFGVIPQNSTDGTNTSIV
ncbi:MAG: CHAP domain-containing protein [Oscillospiraceae bacterium]|nr:CHAP domain-containing protein [Oscillospiraceae bacterium]MCL2279897.1 CHAP domain-containing protein [Oscillospiraceae bacterium]